MARLNGVAGLQSLRQRRERDTAAAPALPCVVLYPRHHGGDCRQVDLVIAAVQPLISLAQRGLAMRALDRLRRDHFVRVRGQCPSAARATQAALTRTAALGLLSAVWLVPLRGRHAGIVRRLRWRTKLRFQLCHARRQQPNLRPQRQDQGILFIMRQTTEGGEWSHPKLESWRPWSRQ